MTFHHGWLLLSEPNDFNHELFNHARTAAYLQSSSVLGCGQVYGVLDDGGCPAYRWMPPGTTDGGELPDPDDVWYEQTYTDPTTDVAPWYNPSFPESGEALGFWVTEWTGLDSGHIQRELTQVGNYGGGGVFGAMGNNAREMGFEIILIGESERALDYLYRWLDATLSSVCATCETNTILLRRFCIDPADLDIDSAPDGVVEMRGVGLMSGLQWGAPPVERAGCYMRRANFTMAATDPCMYGFCTDEPVDQLMDWDDCFTAAALNEGRADCRPSCSELDGMCRTAFDYTVDDPSATAPIVTISPPYGMASIPVRIRTYANGGALTPSELCGAPLLGELYVGSLPAYSELRYDVAGRKVQFRDAGSGGWINGFAYIGPNDPGVPRFFALGCGDFTTVVEPADLCYPAAVNGGVAISGASDIYAIEQSSPAGSLLIGGEFTTARGVTQNNIAKLDPAAALAAGFNTGGTVGTSDIVYDIAVQPDGKIVICGAFFAARGTTQTRIARLNIDGTLDTGFNTGGTVGVNGTAVDVALQSDGKIVIGGAFTTARGTTQNYIARLNIDGTLDTGFNTGGTVGVNNSVVDIAVQSDGKIVIGGGFTTARGTTRNYIARLNTDGTLDTGFNTGGTVGVNGIVRAVALQPDGKIVIGGEFTTARGTTQNRIARLNTDGTLDTGFNTGGTVGVNGIVRDVALQPDGKIVIGGDFTTARGTTQNRIARLNTDGSLDTGFNTGGTVGVGAPVYTVAVQPDGKIVIGGQFTTARGATQGYVAALEPDGSLSPAGLNAAYSIGGSFGGFVDAELETRARMGCA